MDVNTLLMRRIKPIIKRKSLTTKKKKTSSTQKRLCFPKTKSEMFLKSSKQSDQVNQPQPTQAYLDLGQKSFGKWMNCKECGFLYTVGQEDDEKEHQSFCIKYKKGISIPLWKNERTLVSYVDKKARIVELRATDAPNQVKKLMEIKKFLDDALGFVQEPIFLRRTVYIYVQENRVVGCVSAEKISHGYPFEHQQIKSNSKFRVEVEPDKEQENTSIIPAVVGIAQLWVHPSFRNHQIASSLIDIIRRKFIYGMLLERKQIAFAQPTHDGIHFARRYMRTSNHPVLIYDTKCCVVT